KSADGAFPADDEPVFPSADDPFPCKIRIPSCVLLGRSLKNLALRDTSGKIWEYHTQGRGSLTLLDFWGTWCHPCRESLPQLQDLQSRFPALGVIGIAYEQDATREEQARRVNALCHRIKVSYRQLLGGGANCPVLNQFEVRAYPTMVLLD